MDGNSTFAVNASAEEEAEPCSGFMQEGVCVSWFQGLGNIAENLI